MKNTTASLLLFCTVGCNRDRTPAEACIAASAAICDKYQACGILSGSANDCKQRASESCVTGLTCPVDARFDASKVDACLSQINGQACSQIQDSLALPACSAVCTDSTGQPVAMGTQVGLTDGGVLSAAFALNGTLSGMSATGAIGLDAGAAGQLVLTNNGPFTLPTPLAVQTEYSVLVTYYPPGQSCSITNASGAMPTAGPASVTISCTDLPPAPAATLSLSIADQSTGLPISGATVVLQGSSSAVSTSTGSASIATTNGLHLMTVAAPGYVTYVQPFSVRQSDVSASIVLFPAAAPQSIHAASTTVVAGPASLVFPAGAYSSDTAVSVTYLDSAGIVSAGLPATGNDANLDPILVTDVLYVSAPSEPAQPVAVTLPIPAGAAAGSFALYELDPSGAWLDPIQPSAMSGGNATYSVTHFSTLGQAIINTATWIVLPGVTGASYTDTSNVTRTIHPGDSIPNGNTVTLAPGGFIELIDPTGHQQGVTISGGGTIAIGSSVEAEVTTTIEGSDVSLTITHFCPYGSQQCASVTNKAKKLIIITNCWRIGGVRGTDATASCPSCQDPAGYATLNVFDGAVDFSTDGGATSTSVFAGNSFPGGGCCTGCEAIVNGTVTCLAGTADNACGQNNALCDDCTATGGKCVDNTCLAGCKKKGSRCDVTNANGQSVPSACCSGSTCQQASYVVYICL